MYSQHPGIAKRWDREGNNYIQGIGGGMDQQIQNRFNVPLGGLASRSIDPQILQMAQARQMMLEGSQRGRLMPSAGSEMGIQPPGIRPDRNPGMMGQRMPMGMRPMGRSVLNSPGQMMAGAY